MDPQIRTTRRYLGVPSNAKRPPHARRIHEWDRRDVSWDDPEPLSWRTFVYMLPVALIVVAGLVAFCVLMFTLLPGPDA